MYLGNDIVEITKALSNFKNTKARLYNYSLSSTEKKRFAKLLEDDRCFWLLWSMKEALYKSYVKAGLRERFNPKTIEISSIARQSSKHFTGFALYNKTLYNISSSIDDTSIHSISYQKQKQQSIIQAQKKIDNNDYNSQHQEVRRLVLEQLPNERQNVWRIKKDVHQIPYLLHNDNRCHHEISLSHHENMVGAAILF